MLTLREQIKERWEEFRIKRDIEKIKLNPAGERWYQNLMDKMEEQYKRVSL